ncbi:hypothetical protein [Streptomyces sp. Wh19]|uniref:hypothetical protein n=1 Tax=Streptomyces sp. Wh19 TaxID=3076629 RepID=UPI00295842AE|nr:hypothetical protein [Streptomyces sp. Wh19]MDV9196127.1 hypothetical protein [Streptomyces sp. Wh19]
MPKKPIQPTYDELIAEAIVNAAMGTVRIYFDDQSAPGLIDFGLGSRLDAEATDVLEVSSKRDRETNAMWQQINRVYDGRVQEGLNAGWAVQFQHGATIGKGVSNRVIAFLVDLENRGITKVSADPVDLFAGNRFPSTDNLHDAATARKLGLSVVHQIGNSPDLAGRIFPSSFVPTGIARATADAVSPYVNDFLDTTTGANKIKKLAEKGSGKRQHLFIWSDMSHTSVGFALKRGWLPSDAPTVPDHIHTLWLGSFFSFENVYTWRCEEGWRVHRVAEVVDAVEPPSS